MTFLPPPEGVPAEPIRHPYAIENNISDWVNLFQNKGKNTDEFTKRIIKNLYENFLVTENHNRYYTIRNVITVHINNPGSGKNHSLNQSAASRGFILNSKMKYFNLFILNPYK